MYLQFEIDKKLLNLSEQVENELQEIFKNIDKICEYNSLKVLNAFQKYNICQVHFETTTGYGYSDLGRDTIEKVFSNILDTEDCLVRSQFISGTHALTVTLFALLRPNDTVLSINGKPYDTLDEVIGIKENENSLKSFGINYEQIDLIDNDFDYEKIKQTIQEKNIKLVIIQRSRGYALRKSLSLEKLQKVITLIKNIKQNQLIMVDNCYGEFVDKVEPSSFGADVIVGSLIKNLGGGIAPVGAYVAGTSKLIDLISQRLTAPGLGKEVGPSLGLNKSILQGLFFAPHVVASSLKTAVFASNMLEKLGYKTEPKFNEKRSDIVQTIEFGNQKDLVKYCQGIQMGSPIDSNYIPEPWNMPGYKDKVVMASGSFISGSSIELSCDAPIRPPYVAFMQGGLTYEYGKLGVLRAIQNMDIDFSLR